MSGPLDFYKAIVNSATKNAPPPEPNYFAWACVLAAATLLGLAVVGALNLLAQAFGQ